MPRSRYIAVRYRRRVIRRAAEWCEVRSDGCLGDQRLEYHHRKMFAWGGSHRPANLVRVCDHCHVLIHRWTLMATMDDRLLSTTEPRRRWRRHYERR